MRVGVRGTYLDPVAQALFDMGLQGVVSGNASRYVRQRFGRIAYIRDAKIDVATFIVVQVRLAVGQIDGGAGAVLKSVSICVGLPMDGVCRRSDTGLIERKRYDFMTAEIADIADLNSEVVARLPLNIERLIDSIGQFVAVSIVPK